MILIVEYIVPPSCVDFVERYPPIMIYGKERKGKFLNLDNISQTMNDTNNLCNNKNILDGILSAIR